MSLHQDKALFAYFWRSYAHVCPALRLLHRTSFVRQAIHLCHLKERIGPRLRAQMRCDPRGTGWTASCSLPVRAHAPAAARASVVKVPSAMAPCGVRPATAFASMP